MLEYFLDDGLFMWPILFVSVVGMAITIESLFPLNRIRSVNRKTRDVLYTMMVKGASGHRHTCPGRPEAGKERISSEQSDE